MIVQPDFLDHWKTSMLIEILEDDCAPLYVIRLWGHCQNRKTHIFNRGNPNIIKAICKAPHDGCKFESAMVESGFIIIEDDKIIVHDWDVVNASLIANWENGKRGGRPKGKHKEKPMGNPNKTHGLPMDNPSLTHQEPIREEKIRLEKIREDKNTTSSSAVGKNDKHFHPTLEQEKEALLSIPLNVKDTEYYIYQADVDEWQDTFQAIDVVSELKKCRLWSIDNPTKRKTKSGIRRHITSWLSRAQDKGGVKRMASTYNQPSLFQEGGDPKENLRALGVY